MPLGSSQLSFGVSSCPPRCPPPETSPATLLLCLECLSSLRQLSSLFVQLESLRLQFNSLRKTYGGRMISTSLLAKSAGVSKRKTPHGSLAQKKEDEATLRLWEEDIERVGHIFPSQLPAKVPSNDLKASPSATAPTTDSSSSTSVVTSEEFWIKPEPPDAPHFMNDFEMEDAEEFNGSDAGVDPLSTEDSLEFTSFVKVEPPESQSDFTYEEMSEDEECDEVSVVYSCRQLDLLTPEQRNSATSTCGLPCTHCEAILSDSGSLKAHKLKSHVLGSLREGYSRCPFCLKFFATEGDLRTHQDKKHGDINFNSNAPLRLRCFVCKKSPWFGSVGQLCAHERSTMHRINMSGVSAYCNVCRVDMKGNLEALRVHLSSRAHGRQVSSLNYFEINLFCVPCRVNFGTREELSLHQKGQEHKKTVAGFRRRVFKSITYEPEGEVKSEPGRKVQKECVESISGGVVRQCPYCEEWYNGKTHALRFRRHLVQKHPEESLKGGRLHPCLVCFHTFGTEGKLESHMAVHDHLKCTFCSKVCLSKDILRNHLRIHTGEKPFTCSKCKGTFRTLCNLTRHTQNIHQDKHSHP